MPPARSPWRSDRAREGGTHFAVLAGPGDRVGVLAVVPVEEPAEPAGGLARPAVTLPQAGQGGRVAGGQQGGRLVGVTEAEAHAWAAGPARLRAPRPRPGEGTGGGRRRAAAAARRGSSGAAAAAARSEQRDTRCGDAHAQIS
ncbi:hypothetical protein CEXT_517991 [Caerostris extrusa]|uniref:Uncharacterized protein n=1 Tax=Caerostris extrusa TaxID=172846 RepID=A0AAV4SDT5_CAEEX|nr:hypothetical protein CEXT_517991 [Caerostris extrusa]